MGSASCSSPRSTNHDYAMTQALVMLVVAIFVFTNFLVDIVYAWLDPRIRYGERARGRR